MRKITQAQIIERSSQPEVEVQARVGIDTLSIATRGRLHLLKKRSSRDQNDKWTISQSGSTRQKAKLDNESTGCDDSPLVFD